MPTSNALSWSRSSPAISYAVAVLSVGAALAASFLLAAVLDVTPAVSLFLCAILFAAWFGGIGPGLLAMILTVLAFSYFFMAPAHSFALPWADVPRLSLFAVAALFVVLLSGAQKRTAESLRQARDDTQRVAQELDRLNKELRAENAERRRAERALQLVVDTIPVMAASYTPDGQLDFVNKVWRDYTGLTLEERTHPRWGAAIHPDDLPRVEQAWHAHLATGEPFQLEQRMRRADGTYRWYLIDRVPLCDEHGAVIRWYGAGYDIEDRKRALEALRQSQAELAEAQRELQLLIDTIPVLVMRFGPDGKSDFVNRTAYHFTGVDPDGSPNQQWEAAVHPDDLEPLLSGWRAHVRSGEPFETEYRLRRADGQYRRLLVRRVPLRDRDGALIRWYGAGYDIEDHKQAAAALQRSEAYLDEAQRLSQTGSFGWNMSDNSVVWSREAYRILNVDPSAVPSLDLVLEQTHPDDREYVRQQILRAHRGEADKYYEYEHRLQRSDGSLRQIHVRARRIKYDSGEEELVGALMDVTAAREAEQALHEAQAQLAHATRMTTLGEMSASIAHEINQPLAAIVTNGEAGLRWLDRDTPDLDEARSAVAQIVESAGRAGQVIRRIRDLAKRAGAEMSRLDANGVIEEAIGFVQRDAAGQRVALKLQLTPGLPPVRADRIQLQQVVINLVVNGIQAMATVTDRPRVLAVRTAAREPGQVLVAVEDSGVGIEPRNLDRLFKAFYTTKRDGMGIGLSICRSIVEAHGGRVWASPNAGPGMTFQFTLPAYQQHG